ncbi:MAG: BMP family ABC transporter substrate-binding protein [Tissierellia bacterium]|nr:BMP family ABC transporter substrate-binding protein [Tissierellia bacterium]
MKLGKKWLLLTAVLLAFSMIFTACSPKEEPKDEADKTVETAEDANKDEVVDKKEESADKEEEAEKTDAEAPKGDLRILIVTSPSGVDDGSFNEDNYNGIQEFMKSHEGSTVQAVQEPTGDEMASVQAVADTVADYDVVVTPGFQFAGISQIANDNPDKKFILVDSYPTAIDEKEEFENVYAMMFAEEESGFLAGIAAAMETKTNKVAVVNGIAYPSNVNYQWGFESGVNYANKHFGTDVEVVEIESYAGTDVRGENVGGNYVGTFNDESTGKVVGEALIEKGVDIMFVAAGGSGNGVFTAAKESDNAKIIGCDVDQYDDGAYSGGNVVITSALKNMKINVDRALNKVAEGSFKGENALLRADTDSTGIVKDEGRHQLSSETLEKLDEAYAKLKDGSIVPAANFNGHTPEQFPGL